MSYLDEKPIAPVHFSDSEYQKDFRSNKKIAQERTANYASPFEQGKQVSARHQNPRKNRG